ncbi:MAG: tetratricopeptide repeat protein [Polyangiaceae bacterium]
MRRCSAALVAASLLRPALAGAQPPETGPPQGRAPATTPTAPPTAGALVDAQARFRRALELHDEGNLDAARTELRRAYEIAPNYKVLYNLAQVEFELLDYPAALATFEKYLNEGGDRIAKDRRTQVQNDIEKLRGRLGTIEIAVNVTGSNITVDDVSVGTTPLLRPVLVSAGRRRINVSHVGYTTASRSVDVAEGDHATMSVELAEAQPTPPPAAPAAEPAPVAPAPAETAPSPPSPAVPDSPKSASTVPWVGWVATAMLASGAAVTGGLALQRSQRLASDRARYGIDPSDLQRLEREATAFAIASDICAGTAAFAGAISLYLTLSSGSQKNEQGRTVRVKPALGFVSLEGTF